MVQGKHPNQANSGLWLPKKGDDFDRPTLVKYLEFFEDDLQEAKDYRNWINKYAKLPSFKWMVNRADNDIKISQTNLDLSRKLLKDAV
jgi:hypothetical protein